MAEIKMSGLTAEEFIRAKIRTKLELKGEMKGLRYYQINGEDALRWTHEYAVLKANEQPTSDEQQCNIPRVDESNSKGKTIKV